ncbi:GNAT family N-acetyltransferase [Reichenbachiella agariperforans]|uniref:GNAT family N-acetyltransferase n=1 Tax=Reichenbachiella agariperforans TaxID=156994 RepID=UPI001C08D0BC|nr:GNAT family N-acetyltransferase [Reichenbachiella agariperforans]MBU2913255.1 GNAT family N-acetyltransferase [Reichenbachiella agariperforans]
MFNRIKFRELSDDDIDKLFEIYSDKDAMKYRVSQPMGSLDDAARFVENQRLQEGNILTIRKGVELKKNKTLIGTSMYRYDNRRKEECEIGYSIGRAFWGDGLGQEIVKKMVEMLALNEKNRIVTAWCSKENKASIKVLEKNDFCLMDQDISDYNFCYQKRIE